MSSEEFPPFGNEAVWDVLIVGSTTSPGMCKVGEAKRAFEWDQKRGKGSDGATVTYVGKGAAKVAVVFYLWDATHFAAWADFRQLLLYDATKTAPQAVQVYHPSLADVRLTSLVTESIGNIIHEGRGLYSCTVEFLEYNPPPKKSAVSTPDGTNKEQKKPGNQEETDPQQKEIAKLGAIAGLLPAPS